MPPRRERFANLAPTIEEAFRTYRDRVRAHTHPLESSPYHMPDEEHKKFLKLVGTDTDQLAFSSYYGRAIKKESK
jgi:hypothetical protein